MKREEPQAATVTVGKLPIQVKTDLSEKALHAIVREVNDRLEEIEKHSDRIDTLYFALSTALSYAIELDQVKRGHAAELKRIEEEDREETGEILVALDGIAGVIREALAKYEDEE